ncbi:hypothetical protein AX15_007743 [Amanita polypyramis BW_CC]|nr:hypothetical protein AX15_007743 [Amanita polypyramis BW_CC]
MSTSPLSLSFPSPSFQPGRNSTPQNAQLPLPSALSAQSPSRSRYSSNAPASTVSTPSSPHSVSAMPTTPQRPRGMSVLANRALGANLSPSSSPNASPNARSTHAGGIQPSLSFFRPSRPDYQDTYSRASSIASSDDVIEHVPDVYPLSRLSPVGASVKLQTTAETEENDDGTMTEEHLGSMGGVQIDDREETLHEERIPRGEEFGPDLVSSGNMKKSKELLLPLSGRPGGLGAGTSTLGVGVPASATSRDIGKRISGGSLVKNGIDRVFSLGRGLSIESIRRSMADEEATTNGIEGRRTPIKFAYDGLTNGVRSSTHFRRSSASPSGYKHSSEHSQGGAKRHSQSHSVSRQMPISPSPDLSFVSRPPEVSATSPPLSRVPVKDSKKGRLARRYEQHPSRNRFFLKGHLLTGGDSPWAFIICFSIVLGLSGVWFGTTCVWWWRNESPAVAVIGAYMALIVISSMLATAFTDPGILPRDLDPNPPCHTDAENNTIPLPRDLRVRNDSVRVKYCTTCKTYRPPRASHCKMCDNCVDGCDHHCQWVNNCVGRRNYTSFFVLLLTATLTLVLVICTSALHLYLLTVQDLISFRHALDKAPGSAVAFSMAICVIWPVAALLTYHVRVRRVNLPLSHDTNFDSMTCALFFFLFAPGMVTHGDNSSLFLI